MRRLAYLAVILPMAVLAQPAQTPEQQGLQSTLIDQMRALVAAHTSEAALQAQVNELQRQLAEARGAKPAEAPKPP